MPNPHYLVTAADVSRSQLRKFIREQGGRRVDEIYDGEVRTKAGVVWIAWDPEDAKNLAAYDDFLDTERGVQDKANAVKTLEVISEKLGAPPQTYVLLDVLKNWPSERLALKFIKAFDERWGPTVFSLIKNPGTAYSGQEIWTLDELLTFSGSRGRLPR